MSALDIDMESLGSDGIRIAQGIIVPPYEPGAPADGPPVIELGEGDVALELDDGREDGIEVVLGEPIEEENIVRQRAGELNLVVAAFADDMPVLRHGPPTLALSVATALKNLGCDIDEENVRIMRTDALRETARPLPAGMASMVAANAAQAMALAIAPQIAADTGDLLHARFGQAIAEAIGHDGCCDLGALLMRSVTSPFRQRCHERGDHLADLVWKPLHEAFRLYIGFTLAGAQAERGLVAPFVECIKNGHFPIGFLKDRTFLVITG